MSKNLYLFQEGACNTTRLRHTKRVDVERAEVRKKRVVAVEASRIEVGGGAARIDSDHG